MFSFLARLQHRLFGPRPEDVDDAIEDPVDPMPFLRPRPPGCLAAFVALPIDHTTDGIDGHGSPWNTFFEIRCPCQSAEHYVLGHYLTNPPFGVVFVSPLALECKACGKVEELFDTDVHGYDGKLFGKGRLRGTCERTKFKCSTCGVKPFATIAGFEHGAEGVYDDDDRLRPDAQDYFHWF
ncbi:MAG TPA: hypothetical protein VGP63_22660, partial [Planctomycetaceae bacterium]|nr:hypothetical protein [Planctomycetaceae bacterium]